MTLPNQIQLDRWLGIRGTFRDFVEMAWSQVESQPFVDGWHIGEICSDLEAVSRGEITHLIINIPPGMTKSLTVCVLWPVWDWIRNPWRRFMYASFDAGLSQRDALKSQELLDSPWFSERWGATADLRDLRRGGVEPLYIANESGKQKTASIYWTNAGGLRFSTSVGGKATGWHCNIQVCDDPTKPKDVEGGGVKAINALKKTKGWWQGTMASRKADPRKFARVIIMQRLHELDLAGVCKEEKAPDGSPLYTILSLPMEFEAPARGDHRTVPGELLCPARYDDAAVAQMRVDMGPMVYSAQGQQRPAPAGGAIFQRKWLERPDRRWRKLPDGCIFIQSWDCTFEDADTSDWVVGEVWAKFMASFFLVHQVRARMTLPQTMVAITDMRGAFPKARKIVVEKKANGPAVKQMLDLKISGIVYYDPKTSKEGRANAVSGLFEAGNVWLPESAPWVGDYVEEMAGFPKGAHDDQVDCTTQALLVLTDRGGRAPYAGAMAKLGG